MIDDMDLLENMSFDECLQALAAKRVGRIALTHRALPVVFPVNYVLDGHSI
ncbi:MAG: pyridoxamine 5'-phosphate oxidase family protein, partial [Angustibacter sp.]